VFVLGGQVREPVRSGRAAARDVPGRASGRPVEREQSKAATPVPSMLMQWLIGGEPKVPGSPRAADLRPAALTGPATS
jgi:hypothetical protein